MTELEQLKAFVGYERTVHPDKTHIADWALKEIERLTAENTALAAQVVAMREALNWAEPVMHYSNVAPTRRAMWKHTYEQSTSAAESLLRERDAKVLENAAYTCESIAHERFAECGIRESDTGATYYSGSQADELAIRDEEDDICAAALRRMATERRAGK